MRKETKQANCALTVARAGFTLLEVIIAVGLFASVIVAVLGLLGPSLRTERELRCRAVAVSLADRAGEELKRIGFRPLETALRTGSVQAVADAGGSRLVSLAAADNDPLTGAQPGLASRERFFLITIKPSVALAGVPMEAAQVCEVRVAWPYASPATGEPTSEGERMELVFHEAVTP